MQVPDLLGIAAGSVVAPAGCGKTELIATSLARHTASKPVLVLTHTNAGVHVLKQRMAKHSIPKERYRVATIDGWAKRVVAMFPWGSGFAVDERSVAVDYPRVQTAAGVLLSSGNIDASIRATYARLIVDEYQDCNLRQHAIVCGLSRLLATAVLGDPLQAVFNFGGSALVKWEQEVEAAFPAHGQLSVPYRWINVQAQALGDWLIQIRKPLLAGAAIDLSQAPEGVEWVQLASYDDFDARMQAAAYRHPTVNSVLILAESASRDAQQEIARRTPGASRVESVDLRELTSFAEEFRPGNGDCLGQLLSFSSKLMTQVDASGLRTRMDTLSAMRAVKPASFTEQAALEYQSLPSWKNAEELMRALAKNEGARVYRPAMYYGCLTALGIAAKSGRSLVDAAVEVREAQRHKGRQLPQRAVGSTLLMKGLEADAAVILQPEKMDACHLYVALTRGAKRVIICSPTAKLTPALRKAR